MRTLNDNLFVINLRIQKFHLGKLIADIPESPEQFVVDCCSQIRTIRVRNNIMQTTFHYLIFTEIVGKQLHCVCFNSGIGTFISLWWSTDIELHKKVEAFHKMVIKESANLDPNETHFPLEQKNEVLKIIFLSGNLQINIQCDMFKLFRFLHTFFY